MKLYEYLACAGWGGVAAQVGALIAGQHVLSAIWFSVAVFFAVTSICMNQWERRLQRTAMPF